MGQARRRQAHARLVLTGSGGIHAYCMQETTYLGTPCLTARPNTARPVTITHGANRRVSTSWPADLVAAARVMVALGESAG